MIALNQDPIIYKLDDLLGRFYHSWNHPLTIRRTENPDASISLSLIVHLLELCLCLWLCPLGGYYYLYFFLNLNSLLFYG